MFYLISGFIIPYSLYHGKYTIVSYFHYMGKRLSRLLPPYIITIILIQLVAIVLCHYVWGCEHDINFRQIAVNVFFLADLFPQYEWINPIFATLEVELQFYLLIGLLFPLINKHRWTLLLIAVALFGLGRWTIDMDTVLVNSPYFLCGVSIFFIKQDGWKTEYISVLVLAFLCFLNFYYWEDLGAALIGGSLLLLLPERTKLLNWTGKISYSFYLIHGIAGGQFMYFMTQHFKINLPPFVLIGAAILISWACAFLMYQIIERPSMKISKRIKYK